jgi:molecular chaperone GrpE
MAKANKEQEPEEEDRNASESSGSTQPTESTVTEIPIGDGEANESNEANESAEPEVELDPIAQLQAQVAELEEQKLLALADMDNYRKRMARQFETVTQAANDRLLTEFLDVVDNLERALTHSNGDNGATDGNEAAVQEGTTLILQQMRDLLVRFDVRPMETVGKAFNAAWHEALMQVASDEYDEGIVVTEIRKGYMIGDRVLRHARVAVSLPPSGDE